MEATDPETHAPVPAKTERSYIERLQEVSNSIEQENLKAGKLILRDSYWTITTLDLVSRAPRLEFCSDLP